MKTTMKNHQNPFQQAIKPMMYGAGFGVLFASYFVIMIISHSTTTEPIMFLPLLTVSVGGAMGGYIFNLLKPYRIQKGGTGFAAMLIGLLIFAAGIWLSLIAALAALGLWD